MADRFTAVAGAFFADVPPADYFLLKWILHDWSDDDCLRILRSCRRSYIDDHLGESDLTPARIAAAHSISVRTVYSLFAEVGAPVSAYIRQRRLSRSYLDVVQDNRESMGKIARPRS